MWSDCADHLVCNRLPNNKMYSRGGYTLEKIFVDDVDDLIFTGSTTMFTHSASIRVNNNYLTQCAVYECDNLTKYKIAMNKKDITQPNLDQYADGLGKLQTKVIMLGGNEVRTLYYRLADSYQAR